MPKTNLTFKATLSNEWQVSNANGKYLGYLSSSTNWGSYIYQFFPVGKPTSIASSWNSLRSAKAGLKAIYANQ